MHAYRVFGPGPVWDWNKSTTHPTFGPSLLYHGNEYHKRCHLFVRSGNIEFCGDCEHELAGKTVAMTLIKDIP